MVFLENLSVFIHYFTQDSLPANLFIIALTNQMIIAIYIYISKFTLLIIMIFIEQFPVSPFYPINDHLRTYLFIIGFAVQFSVLKLNCI